jgi:type I restriction-modification system DNA methylase subunit
LIGAALRLLTDDAENQATLKTSLGTLTRVLDAVHWPTISKGNPDTWLYFYEDFLEIYDNKLRKQTGSYYTPPEVVNAMVRLVDEVLRSRFTLHSGLASPVVTIANPAVGTGTFLLGTLRRIAETIEIDEGTGAVPGGYRSCHEPPHSI